MNTVAEIEEAISHLSSEEREELGYRLMVRRFGQDALDGLPPAELRETGWLEVLKNCPEPMDDLPPRSPEIPKSRKL